MVIQQLIKLVKLYVIKFNSIGVEEWHRKCEYSRNMINAGIFQDCYRCRLVTVGSDDSCTETGERNTPPLCGDAEYLRSSPGELPYRLCCLYGIIFHTFIQRRGM